MGVLWDYGVPIAISVNDQRLFLLLGISLAHHYYKMMVGDIFLSGFVKCWCVCLNSRFE